MPESRPTKDRLALLIYRRHFEAEDEHQRLLVPKSPIFSLIAAIIHTCIEALKTETMMRCMTELTKAVVRKHKPDHLKGLEKVDLNNDAELERWAKEWLSDFFIDILQREFPATYIDHQLENRNACAQFHRRFDAEAYHKGASILINPDYLVHLEACARSKDKMVEYQQSMFSITNILLHEVAGHLLVWHLLPLRDPKREGTPDDFYGDTDWSRPREGFGESGDYVERYGLGGRLTWLNDEKYDLTNPLIQRTYKNTSGDEEDWIAAIPKAEIERFLELKFNFPYETLDQTRRRDQNDSTGLSKNGHPQIVPTRPPRRIEVNPVLLETDKDSLIRQVWQNPDTKLRELVKGN